MLPLRPSAAASPNVVHRALRNRDDDARVGPLSPARSADAVSIERVARNLATTAAGTRHVLYATGLGMDVSGRIPVRLPALLLPALRAMERVKTLGLEPPRYVVYQADRFIARTNGIPDDCARETAERMRKYLRGYVDALHSTVASSVDLCVGMEETDEALESIARIGEDIRARAMTCMTTRQIVAELEESERRRSLKSGEALTYAAANVYFNGAAPGAYPFDLPQQHSVVLPVGGRAEKPFFALTSTFADDLRGRDVLPLVTPLGFRPTYFHCPEQGDPLTAESFRDAKIQDGPIRGDLDALRADGLTPELVDFLLSRHP